jgi:hypothetical protein
MGNKPHPPIDPIEWLRANDPADSTTLNDDEADRIVAEALRRGRTTTSNLRPFATIRRRHKIISIVSTLGLLGAASLTVAWIRYETRTVRDRTTIQCFAERSLTASSVLLSAARKTPVEACKELWASGEFNNVSSPSKLSACTLPGGAAGVFPGDHICDLLGLKPSEGTTDDERNSGADFVDAVTATVNRQTCLSTPDARAALERVGSQTQRSTWTITVAVATDQSRPCAILAIDEAAHTITLTAFPK